MTRIDEPDFRVDYTKIKSPDVDREDNRVGIPSQNGFPRLRLSSHTTKRTLAAPPTRQGVVRKESSLFLGLRGFAAHQTALDVLGVCM